MAQLIPGDSLRVSSHASGLLVLDEIPDARNLWLMATGTGIGPLLSLLKTVGPWLRFNKIVLGHSVRYAAELVYPKLITSLLAIYENQLCYVPIVSRET